MAGLKVFLHLGKRNFPKGFLILLPVVDESLTNVGENHEGFGAGDFGKDGGTEVLVNDSLDALDVAVIVNDWDATAARANDDEAVIVTLQNAANNHFQNHINAYAGNGYNTPAVSQNAPYDLVLSNILARPLIEMAPDMARCLCPGGHAVISGFVDNQQDWVLAEHQKQGLLPVKTYSIENWRAALLQKV